jgi:hypothetical protein
MSISVGPAVECDSCGVTEPVAETDDAFVNNECPFCGEFAEAIIISECPLAGLPNCSDEEHHFGTGFHHAEAKR